MTSKGTYIQDEYAQPALHDERTGGYLTMKLCPECDEPYAPSKWMDRYPALVQAWVNHKQVCPAKGGEDEDRRADARSVHGLAEA